MLIQEKPFRHWINHFYGYGSWSAKYWFIAHEEGGGDLPEEVAEKLNYFYQAHGGTRQPTLCDIRDLYRAASINIEGPRASLYNNLFDYRFGDHAVLHGVWKNLIAFVHGYEGKPIPDLLSYQQKLFALPSANREALIRLYPLPAPHNHAWYYSWLDMPSAGFLKTRSAYQEHLYQQRTDGIFSEISLHKPELVLMYGMSNINALKKSVNKCFPAADFKMMKAIKGQIPQHHLADLAGTKLMITTQIPALRHNRIETGFDWELFGKMLS